MKNRIILIVIAAGIAFTAKAQVTVPEPEFSNTVVYLNSDSTSLPLERQKAEIKTKSSASLNIIGVGKVSTIGLVTGEKSPVRIPNSESISFIARVQSNTENPMDVITVAKFEVNTKKHNRYIEIAKAASFQGAESGNVNTIGFEAVKYGQNSYLITVKKPGPGEYVITLASSSETAHMFGVD